MAWPIDYVHGTYLRYLTFPVSASTRSPTPSGGTRNTVSSPDKRILDDIKKVADFITSYAETHALVLPGRVSSHKRYDILLLPSSCTKADIHRQYQDAMSESEHRCVAASTFRNLWLQLLPCIVCSRPMTDLCWECQRNNRDISTSSNLPEVVKVRLWVLMRDQSLTHLCIDISLYSSTYLGS